MQLTLNDFQGRLKLTEAFNENLSLYDEFTAEYYGQKVRDILGFTLGNDYLANPNLPKYLLITNRFTIEKQNVMCIGIKNIIIQLAFVSIARSRFNKVGELGATNQSLQASEYNGLNLVVINNEAIGEIHKLQVFCVDKMEDYPLFNGKVFQYDSAL